MAADDLSAPLGQETKRGRGLSTAIKASLPQAIAIALAAFLGAFVLWAVIRSAANRWQSFRSPRPGQRRRGSSADRPRTGRRP